MFDKEAVNLFAIQDEIARTVTRDVAVAVLNEVRTPLDNVGLEAYELYLLGRQKAMTPDATRAVDLFEMAIEQDPRFAAAYAGLADALLQTVRNRDTSAPGREVIAQANALADRAIELAPMLADGYTSKMLLAAQIADYNAVDSWYRKAVELKPGHMAAHLYYADVLQRSGVVLLDASRLDLAASVLNEASLLDPLNSRLRQRLSSLAHLRGDADALRRAEQSYSDAQSRADAAEALETLARISADRGSLDQAIAYLMIATEGLERTTGTIRLELAGHYLQLQHYAAAERWLDSVPRPLDFMGALQQTVLYAHTDQPDLLDEILKRIASGEDDSYAFTEVDGRIFAFLNSANPLNCDRAFSLLEYIDLAGLRGQLMQTPDMMLAECYSRRGDDSLARKHRRHAFEIGKRMKDFPAQDAFLFYEIAKAEAFAGDREAAIDHLEFAYDRGACFMKTIESDPFLDKLKDLDRFRLLMAEFRATIERMRRNVYRAESSGDWYQLVGLEAREW